MLVDERGVAVAGGSGEPCGEHGVEHLRRGAEAQAIQHAQVEVGAVHHQFGARQRVEQRRQVDVGQRIDQLVGSGQADLHQADLLVVAMQAVGLGVYADTIRGGDASGEIGQRGLRLNHGGAGTLPQGRRPGAEPRYVYSRRRERG